MRYRPPVAGSGARHNHRRRPRAAPRSWCRAGRRQFDPSPLPVMPPWPGWAQPGPNRAHEQRRDQAHRRECARRSVLLCRRQLSEHGPSLPRPRRTRRTSTRCGPPTSGPWPRHPAPRQSPRACANVSGCATPTASTLSIFLARRRRLAVAMQRPGQRLERADVLPSRRLAPGQGQRIGGPSCVVGVVVDQLDVGGVPAWPTRARAAASNASHSAVRRPRRPARSSATPSSYRFSGCGATATCCSRSVTASREPALLRAHLGHLRERVVIVGEQRQRLGQQPLGRIGAAREQRQVRDLRQDPRAVLHLGVGGPAIGRVHQLDGALVIAEQLAQVRGAGQRRHVARPDVEHPLRRLLGLGIAARARCSRPPGTRRPAHRRAPAC